VSKLALDLVYIGIGVLVSTYVGNVLWIISGERISRRIREYYLTSNMRLTVENIYKLFSVRISLSLIAWVPEKSPTAFLTISI